MHNPTCIRFCPLFCTRFNGNESAQEDEEILIRWKHLKQLVEFALSMQRTLQSINDQSFNHFVLRMGELNLHSLLRMHDRLPPRLVPILSLSMFRYASGINHGPTTAGVIGATKPHYDIWGNAVNVASRMESTGKAGCIQVTSPTYSDCPVLSALVLCGLLHLSIQVTEETSAILRHFGYNFEQRGLVFVKGKGQLLTYYLIESESSAT